MSSAKLHKEDIMHTPDEIRKAIAQASPLEMPRVLNNIELYDQKNSQEILDEIYQEFESGKDKEENVVIPVFTAIVDNFLRKSKAGRELQSKGLSTTRIVDECRSFSYDEENISVLGIQNKNDAAGKQGDAVAKTINEDAGLNIQDNYINNRKSLYEDKKAMDKYKKDKYSSNNKTTKDEYDPNKRIYQSKNNVDLRTTDSRNGKTTRRAETDHIIPLEKVHSQLKGNCLLTDSDVKSIANMEDNFAITSETINRKKGKLTNTEFIDSGKADEAGLDDTAKAIMKRKEQEAQKAINKEANKKVINNYANNKELRQKVNDELAIKAVEGAKAGAGLAVGTFIVEVFKPMYYELKDMLLHGIEPPMGVSDKSEALGLRLQRIRIYLSEKWKDIASGGITDILKTALNALISGIINLFFGVVKTFLTYIRDGFTALVSMVRILADSEKSTAQKGDAVLKLVATTVLGMAGSSLANLVPGFNSLPEAVQLVVQGIVIGCGAVLVFRALEALDLFAVKAEMRYARVQEIFDARRQAMEDAAEAYDVAAMEQLTKQRAQFSTLSAAINQGLNDDNMEVVNNGLLEMADFFRVDIPYRSREEFVEYMSSKPKIVL